MKIITKNDPYLQDIINRGGAYDAEYLTKTAEIIEKVRREGDGALRYFSEIYDGFSPDRFEIDKGELITAYNTLNPALKEALDGAAKRIADFHRLQIEKSWFIEDAYGSILGQTVAPVGRVGVYVPGGKAAYPSSVLMNVIPAKVAGVKEICMATPAPKGEINRTVLAAAHIAGAERVFCIGGAQAIAAFAYGTESVPKADKIVGPGNIYVALAKKLVYGAAGVDMPAGPSEVLIIADDTAKLNLVAADMLAQAEHDELASANAIVYSSSRAHDLEREVARQILTSDRREIIEKSVNERSAIIIAENFMQAAEIANAIAPEHLELHIASPLEGLRYIRNAGAVFLGEYSPEAAGDYTAGTNHVLPTGGCARFSSPLGVYDFIKRTSVIYYTKDTLSSQKEWLCDISAAEGLYAHQNSVRLRE
ncbi:MAG: histidinol dehydrogenase [Deferribacteraceae bacterium]|jgi:histidinol dehydrogenase|nr:histidinol dehydrogenase [Deferribacteraceae bacterium]